MRRAPRSRHPAADPRHRTGGRGRRPGRTRARTE
jgi:hypothetical protein